MTKKGTTRQEKAELMYVKGIRAEKVGINMWEVPGSSEDSYDVSCIKENDFSCTCRDFTIHGEDCKHILLTKLCLSRGRKPTMRDVVAAKAEIEYTETPEPAREMERVKQEIRPANDYYEQHKRRQLTHGIDW